MDLRIVHACNRHSSIHSTILQISFFSFVHQVINRYFNSTRTIKAQNEQKLLFLVFLNSNKKAGHKPDSVSINRSLSFIWMLHYCNILAAYPPTSGAQPSNIGLHDVAPHRVYLISLQHYLYILSVALVLASRPVGVTHYAALWCPDFPLSHKYELSDRADLLGCKCIYLS